MAGRRCEGDDGSGKPHGGSWQAGGADGGGCWEASRLMEGFFMSLKLKGVIVCVFVAIGRFLVVNSLSLGSWKGNIPS